MFVDLVNAFIQAPCHEKILCEGSLECREDQGKVCVVVQLLYRLKSASTTFHSSLAQSLQDLGYQSTKVDPDIWICKAVPDNDHKYYEMLFVYIDDILALSHKNDILALSHKAKATIMKITQFFTAKEGSVKPLDIYLSANISQFQLLDGHEVWATSPKAYVKNLIQFVECLLTDDGQDYVLKVKCEESFSHRLQA